jgi:DNA-binding transcriptional LysR family regulator
MVHSLEEELSTTLIVRSRKGATLTPDGEEFLPYIRELHNSYRELLEKHRAMKGLQSGLVRIGTFSSVATHWLPNIIKEFQKDYPNIDYELLLGDYTEIESWISEGRVDCGFLRLPTLPEFETIFLEQDKLLVVLPENHPLADCEYFPVKSLCDYPFMLLEKGAKAEISEIFERCSISPKVHFTTWDDYAIMSMVESGLGISILPQLILKRIPYRIVTKELDVPAYRKIGLALKDKKSASLAVKRFLDYIDYRYH